MAAKKTIPFEASARLQSLIGRGLIPNEEMAIVELVKNSYDSGATTVSISIQQNSIKNPGFIRIIDDGAGMSEAEIERLFMFAGYSERPDEVATARRIPTGEKGIGRFAADKLGQQLDVYTRKANKQGIHLAIDWRKFDAKKSQKFSDVEATYENLDVLPLLRTKSGTHLEITLLRSTWDTDQIERLLVWLSDLLDPFAKPKDFTIDVEVHGSTRRMIRIDPQIPTGEVTMDISVAGGRVHRIVRERGERKPIVDDQADSTADLRPLRGLRAHFVHFDQRPKKAETHGLLPGVRVYRDGFRIEPFGSRDSDWLGVAEHRAKRAGHAHIVPNRLFGFVEISRKKNPALGDTTSRQALIDSQAARSMVTVLREGLQPLAEVLKSRREPRWKENRERRQAELEQARLHTLGEIASGLAHELRQPLQSIRTEAGNIRAKLAKLKLVDRDIEESQEAIDRGIVRIDKNITLVSELSKGSLTDLAETDLAELLRRETSVFSNRSGPLGIELTLMAPESLIAIVNELVVSIAVYNFLQNSMQSIEANGGSRIDVSLRKTRRGYRVEVEDDGGGVSEDVIPKLFTKFATRKTGGMGVGLHYCRILVESLRGGIGHEPIRGGARFWIELPEN